MGSGEAIKKMLRPRRRIFGKTDENITYAQGLISYKTIDRKTRNEITNS